MTGFRFLACRPVGRLCVVALAGGIAPALWCGLAHAAPVEFDFEADDAAAAWTVTGAGASAEVTHNEGAVRRGKGALLCHYMGQPGSAFSLTAGNLNVAGARSLSLSILASSEAPLVLILAEEDGSQYHTFVTLPAGEWCDIALPLTDLQLQDGTTDENGVLDADQVRSFTIQELANMAGEWGRIFSTKPGEQSLTLDAVRFGPEEVPSRSQADNQKVLVDDFSRPWFSLLPLGDARLSHIEGHEGKPASALGIAFTFVPSGPKAWPGVVLPIGHVDLSAAKALRLRVKAPGAARLHLLLEEQDGSRYELQADVPEAEGWQARDFALSDFALEAKSTDENGALDRDQLRVLIVVIDAWNSLLDEQGNGQFGLDDVLFLK